MKYWDKAWSLVEGCTPVSVACDHCWLRAINNRFKKKGTHWDFIDVMIREDRLDIPRTVAKPTVWAIWSDLFHEKVPIDFIMNALAVMNSCPQHTFLILTKRPYRIRELIYNYDIMRDFRDFPSNIWLGVTAENQERWWERVSELCRIGGVKKFVSVEPMLGPIEDLTQDGLDHFNYPGDPDDEGDTDMPGVDAVICGCESGPGRRETKIEWVRNLRDQCQAAEVPFLLKQLDVNGKVQPLPALDGIIYDAMPWRDHGKS